MASHVTVAEVQSWLDQDKLPLAPNDPLPEEANAAAGVLARLANVYPEASTWTDNTNTPALVRVIISALTAAYRYNKIYSEEEDAGNRYAGKLEGRALEMLSMLVNGDVLITDVPVTLITSFDPLFWPGDLTGATKIYDGQGLLIGWEGSEDIKFHMSDRF